MYRREYVETVEATRSELNATYAATSNLKDLDYSSVSKDETADYWVGSILSFGLGYLALSKFSIAAGVTLGNAKLREAANILAGFFVSESFRMSIGFSLNEYLRQGKDEMEKLTIYVNERSYIEAVRVKISFLDFPDQGVKFVTHTSPSYIEAVKINGVWTTSS